jgi:hypothetical protein
MVVMHVCEQTIVTGNPSSLRTCHPRQQRMNSKPSAATLFQCAYASPTRKTPPTRGMLSNSNFHLIIFIFVVVHSLKSFFDDSVLLIDRFAFIEFKDEAMAEKNLPILKKKKVGGNEIVIDYCGSKAINAPPQKPQKVRTEPGSYTV